MKRVRRKKKKHIIVTHEGWKGPIGMYLRTRKARNNKHRIGLTCNYWE